MGPRYSRTPFKNAKQWLMSARKFWKYELVRLKYHNPAVPMTIDRTALDTDPATMSIHFAPSAARQTSDSATSSPAPTDSTTSSTPPSDHDPTERVETIEMKGRTSAEILEDFTQMTRAFPVEATPEEREELRLLEEQRVKSLRDSQLSKEVKERKAREDALLKQAVGDVQAN